MSRKYLGQKFDIHGGGMDLKFPHHECEIAQAESIENISPVNYWLHANMLTLNGKKMAKSTGNNILPDEMFNGSNKLINKPFSPMTVRFFMLQAHYRSIIDISQNALEASEKGFNRLTESLITLEKIKSSNSTTYFNIAAWKENCYKAMNDDFNSPVLIAQLFDATKFINAVANSKKEISKSDLNCLKETFHHFYFDVLGLNNKTPNNSINTIQLKGVLDLVLDLRKKARNSKDFKTSDLIRESLLKLNIQVYDSEERSSFKIK